MNEDAILLAALDARKKGIPYATVTIAKAEGATPRRSGKMLVYGDGTTLGTVGGGASERMASLDAVKCLKRRENGFFEYDMTGESSPTGMVCGGRVSVLIEVFTPRPLLVICGAGHVAEALMPVARSIGFSILLIDDRDGADMPGRIALADRFIRMEDYRAGIGQADIPAGAYFVIVTHGHAHDGDALAGALCKDAAYIGMIGSRHKIAAVYAALRESGTGDEALSSVYSPIGLDIGGETPAEIAISIAAELLSVRYGRNGGHLRDTKK